MKDVAEDPTTEYITSRFMVVSYTTRYYNSGTTGYQAFFFFFSLAAFGFVIPRALYSNCNVLRSFFCFVFLFLQDGLCS